MKSLFTLIISTFIYTLASATNIGDLKIGFSNKNSITAKFTAKSVSIATITITNESGQVVNTQKVNITLGANNVSLINVSDLLDGTYNITIVANNEATTTSFINLKMD